MDVVRRWDVRRYGMAVQALLARSPHAGMLVLAIRAPRVRYSEWMNNWRGGKVDCLARRSSCGRVASRYGRAWDAIRRSVVASVRAAFKNAKRGTYSRLLVTGDGQGGAVAAIAAVHLASYLPGHVELVARYFGSTRPGDAAFRTAHDRLVPDALHFVTVWQKGTCPRGSKQGIDWATLVPPRSIRYVGVGQRVPVECPLSCSLPCCRHGQLLGMQCHAYYAHGIMQRDFAEPVVANAARVREQRAKRERLEAKHGTTEKKEKKEKKKKKKKKKKRKSVLDGDVASREDL